MVKYVVSYVSDFPGSVRLTRPLELEFGCG
jgi:hypothetical protein